MLVFVACWPLLASLAGKLIPAIGAGDFQAVLRSIGLALAVFMVQKAAQFGQDTLLAGPALAVSQDLRRQLFARLQRLEFGALEKLSAGDLTKAKRCRYFFVAANTWISAQFGVISA